MNLQLCVFLLLLSFVFLSQHITNPRKAAGQQDLVVNNPLSQDEGVSVCMCVEYIIFIKIKYKI